MKAKKLKEEEMENSRQFEAEHEKDTAFGPEIGLKASFLAEIC